MNIFQATQSHDTLPLIAPWYWGISSFDSANGETTAVVECGYQNATTLISVVVQGEFQDVLDVEQAVKQIGCYEFSTGPINGGGYFPKK